MGTNDSFRITPFLVADLDLLTAEFEHIGATLGEPQYRAVAAAGPAWSGWRGDLLVCCAGIAPAWPGRGIAWAVWDAKSTTRDKIRVTLEMRRRFEGEMESAGLWRVEAHVLKGWKPGYKWATALGFEAEGVLRRFLPDGSDAVMFARVREED